MGINQLIGTRVVVYHKTMRAIRKPRTLVKIRKVFETMKDWTLNEDQYNTIMLDFYNQSFEKYFKQFKLDKAKNLNDIIESFNKIFDLITDVKEFSNVFNEWLDHMLWDDFFGSEGQCDPRGDRRE